MAAARVSSWATPGGVASSNLRPLLEEATFLRTVSSAATDTPVTDRTGLQWDAIRDLRQKGLSDQQILIQAIQANNLDLVGAIIANEPPQGDEKIVIDLDDTSQIGAIPLHLAVPGDIFADRDEPLMLKLLIHGGADIALLDQGGYSAYAHAAQYDNPQAKKVAEWLKAEMNRQAEEAAAAGDQMRVDELVAAGADPLESAEVDEPEMPDVAEVPTAEEVADFERRVGELDIYGSETTEKGADGSLLTVSELALKTIINKYKEGIDSGEIKADDPRYKFYYTLMAQADINSGRSITPYRENGTSGTSERWEGNPAQATPEDMRSLYREEGIDEKVEQLFTNEAVAKDYAEALAGAVGKVPNKSKIKSDIEEIVKDPRFRVYLAHLRQTDDAKVMQTVQQLVGSYSLVASEDEVNDLMSDLMVSDYLHEVESILADPDKIGDKAMTQATLDVIQWVHEFINRSTQIGRHSLNTEVLVKVFREFLRLKSAGKLPEGQDFNTTWAQITKKVKGAGDGDIKKFFTDLNDRGAFSTVIGVLALSSSIYQLAGVDAGNGVIGEDHMQNLQVARGFLLFLGTAPEITKWGSQLTSQFPRFAHFMGSGDTAAIFGAKSVQDIFKVDPGKVAARSPWISSFVGKLDLTEPIALDPKYSDGLLAKLADRFDGNANQLKTKWAAAVVKVGGAAAFTGFGIVDAVLGGLVLKRGIDTGSGWDKFQGVLQILTGTFTTAAGVAMGFGAAGFAAAALVIPPLLLVAAVLGMVIVLFDIVKFVQMWIDLFKEDDTVTFNQLEYFQRQADLGHLEEDWGRKLEFMVLSFYRHDFQGGNDIGVNSRRPWTSEGVSLFDHYDWQGWLSEYQKYHDADYSLPDGPPPLTENSERYDELRAAGDRALNELAIYYAKEINFEARSVPEVTDPYVRERFEILVALYMAGKRPDYSPEAAADWVIEEMIGRIKPAFQDHDDVVPGNENWDWFPDWSAEAPEEAATMIRNNWSKHGGRDKGIEIAREVIDEDFRDNPAQGHENNLNAIAMYYYNWYANNTPSAEGHLGTDVRGVPNLEGELADRFKEMVRYYMTHIKRNTSAQQAADWATEQIAGRLPTPFEHREGELGDRPMDGEDAAENFLAIGSDRRLELANEVVYG